MNNGQWGLVCADGWDTHDAIVVCQEEGLGNNGTAIKFPYNNNETETVWLSGVDCMGNESQLSFCPHNGIGVVEDCEVVAGVECFGKICTTSLQKQRFKGWHPYLCSYCHSTGMYSIHDT